ncbi:MAG: glutamine synthetase III [Leptotrichia wadei]|jgi:glutamine synthetase catalytic region|uniref:Glutamine synthetase n=2 Tax=Leptotrichia TaxID=32067 RepID=A0A510KW64_9FUSO|nr:MULTISPECIES: glutamine synthetase III [Leptotrichia]MBS6020030.1 glutamine synthetase III [Leptotrichia wadei]NWO26821.1 glutamine synthetase III [Leptotrichia sp. oral taxon 417]BBM54403.1 glutamine synthetase [Leptotrichia wadei]
MENAMKSFGENVFRDSNLKKRVSKEVFKEFKASQLGKTELSKEAAEVIANAIKDWATKRGATHYCHWFQPLTDLTAEKHDSFLEPTESEELIYKFSGSNLIKGEPDASSFPNGGLRSTFEARGYTIWDTSSYPFIRKNKNGVTLYIPTAFISFTGEALDKKVPLLRTMKYISEQSLRVLRALGNTTSKHVFNTLGVEQEYFLVKKELFEARDDLLLTGRTLFGAPAPKGQELNDHYFGKIKDKVINFMSDVDVELWKLGIPSKTRHNEVAPNQFEVAPLFSVANLASDQNQIIMETIEKTALKHGLVALLHEKPFDGVNGSGKHNNWSLGTDDGDNLFSPGKDPKTNTNFLIFTSAVIEAVDRYYPMLRYSTATATNDHRLGGHEAPPAIISIFLGEELTTILDNIANKKDAPVSEASEVNLSVDVLPTFSMDAGDRNRTSPFAFTGNKFEFRMPGSSSTPATTAAVINAAVGKVLSEYADKLEKATEKTLPKVINEIIANAYKKHHRIIFNGNGYSEEWVKEAKRRGLTNEVSANTALRKMVEPEILELVDGIGMLSEQESLARYNAYAERYVKQISIESRTLIDIVNKNILPSALKFANLLADHIEKNSKYGKAFIKEQEELLKDVLSNVTALRKETKSLEKEIARVSNEEDLPKQTDLAKEKLVSGLEALRVPCDNLEKIIDKDLWKFPTYTDLLFKL